MKQVASGVYIGDIEDAASSERLVTAGITTVLKLTHAAPEPGYPESMTVVDHRMIDGPQNDPDAFAAAVREALALLERDETILVHCKRGTSRSGAVVAAILAEENDCSVDAALERIRQQKPDVDPHAALRRHARQAIQST